MRSGLPDIRILPATEHQIPLILQFIRKLAEYEKLLGEVVADEETLRRSLFGSRPPAEALLAYIGEAAVGFAIFFQNFSTFLGRPGIYLEDLFVDPAFRGRGIGFALLRHIAKLAKERGCGRLNWAVLDWNEPAINFYKSLGAVPLSDWTVFRLSGEPLDRLASSKSDSL